MNAKTILIADDEPHLTHIVAYNLRKAGFDVRVTGNGSECVKLAAEVRPDLIVTDYQMPQLDGLAACKQLKLNPQTAGVPVIMLTARGHRVTPVDLAQTNIVQLLPKPFSARDLLARVHDVFSNQTNRMAA